MGISRIIFFNNTLIDLREDTVVESKLLDGYTAHDEFGDLIVGNPNYEISLGESIFNKNGVYKASDDGYDGYSEVTIDVTSTIPQSGYAYFFYNYPISISNNVTSCANLFYNCRFFNQPINIPDSVTTCHNMFFWCTNFNSPVIIGNNVTNCQNMFYDCWNFNQPVIIPNSVITCNNMFNHCNCLNSPVTIGSGVTDCNYMFCNCQNFNSSLTINNGVTNCFFMFHMCYNFNQPVNIPDSVINCQRMFSTCNRLNSPITIGSGVTDCSFMFQWCNNLFTNIYINKTSNLNTTYMFYRKDEATRVNVFCNNLSLLMDSRIVDYQLTWTEMTNGYYNAVCNIYLYNNYSKETGPIP